MLPAALTRSRQIAQAVTDHLGGQGLFGKPESFVKRRMGVALARGTDTDQARATAKLAASKVKPRVA